MKTLRSAIEGLAGRHAGLPLPALVILATNFPGARMTIDMPARGEIGCAIVVVEPTTQNRPILACLSNREREVALLLREGRSNKAIAAVLGLSPATVKDHVHAILFKTGRTSRMEFVCKPYDTGMLPHGETVRNPSKDGSAAANFRRATPAKSQPPRQSRGT